jgi:hypothetical protein
MPTQTATMPTRAGKTTQANATVEMLEAITRQLAEIRAQLDQMNAAPANAPTTDRPRQAGTETGPTAREDEGTIPTTGRQLYAWSTRHKLTADVIAIGEARGFPARIIAWNPTQVETAYYDLFGASDDRDMGPEPDDVLEHSYGY